MATEKKKTKTFSEAFENFKKARESIDIAIKNLNKTQKNLNNANNNFKQYKISINNKYVKAISKFSIPSLEETAKLLEGSFISYYFEDNLKNQMIIINEKLPRR